VLAVEAVTAQNRSWNQHALGKRSEEPST